jgi:O-antigen ligase
VPWIVLTIAIGGFSGLLAREFGLLAIPAALALAVGGAFVFSLLRSPLAALVCALAALPLDIYGRLIEQPVPFTLYQVLLLTALAAWAWAIWREQLPFPRPSAVDAGMLLLVLAGAWSFPHSLAPSVTALGIIRLTFIWAFVLLVENVPQDRKDVRVVLGAVAVIAAAHALLGVAQALVPDLGIGNVHVQGQDDSLRRSAGFFDDPNYYAGMLSAGFIAAGALLVYAKRWREALLWAPVALLCAAGIVVTYSRTAWLALLAGSAVLALASPKRVRVWLVAAGAGLLVAAVLVAPGAITSRLASLTDFRSDNSIATRVFMAKSMVDMVGDDPVWGTVLAAFDRLYPLYREVGSSSTILRPHQVPLGLAAETGIAGVLAMLVLVGAVVWVFATRPRGELWEGEAAALAGLACMGVMALFQYNLYFEYLWLSFGLAVVSVRVRCSEEEPVDD